MTDERENLRSYLKAQSAKLTAPELARRLDEAGTEFFEAVAAATPATSLKPPAAGEWSVAEIVEHVALTIEDVAAIIERLTRGERPERPMTTQAPPSGGRHPFPATVARLRERHRAVCALLAGQEPERFTDLLIDDNDFGPINWKGYALILRLHYKDHSQQVRRTLEAVGTHGCA